MNVSSLFRRLLIVCLIVPITVFAQKNLKGKVVDSLTAEPLIGANVVVMGTSLGAATDLYGEFKIQNLPAGVIKLKISFIGYKQTIVETVITDGGANSVDIRLRPDVVIGEEIVVRGQALGQAAAINQQITANTIINVISEEKIQSMPDANAAEAIGRLPGVALQRSGGEANKIVMRGMSDKFSVVTVDGVRLAPTDPDSRGVDLSAISQGSLAGVELFKALTPDKDGDAIAGSVNLVTKKAPETRLLRLDSKGAYNELMKTGSQYDFGLRYGERFLNNVLGVQVTGNAEKRDRSNESIDVNYLFRENSLGATIHEMNDFILDHNQETRFRNGGSLLLDINTPDDGCIRINNIYNQTNRDYATYERHYPTTGQANSNAGGVPYSVRYREQEINTFNSSIRGENNLFSLLHADWGVSFAQSKSENPYDFDLEFSEPGNIQLDSLGNKVYVSGMKAVPTSVIRGSNPEDIIPYAINNFQKATASYGYYRNQKNLDKERTAFLDLSGKYELDILGADLTGEVKGGGKYRYKNRFKQSSELLANYYNTPLTQTYGNQAGVSVGNDVYKVNIPRFAGTQFANLYTSDIRGGYFLVTNFMNQPYSNRNLFDTYNLYPMIDPNAIKAWYSLNSNEANAGLTPEFFVNNQTGLDYYDIIERVWGSYLMNTTNIGQRITLIFGARVEGEDNDYKSKMSVGPISGPTMSNGTIKDTSASHTETVWLPNVQMSVRPTDFLTVRAAAYKALARPDFNARLNKYVLTNSNGVTLTLGNSNLMAAKAWNYELNTSFFSNDLGLFTISGFYKEIEDMYHTLTNASTVNDTLIKYVFHTQWTLPSSLKDTYYSLTYPYNSAKPTKVWGFEIEHQTTFKYFGELLNLPFMKNIVLNYNFSLMKSETYVYETMKDSIQQLVTPPRGNPYYIYKPTSKLIERKDKLEGQPEFFGNIALGYDMGNFSVRLSLFFQAEYTSSFSLTGQSDQVQGKFSRLDLACKYELNQNLSFFFNVNNITNTEESTYIQNHIDNWKVLNTKERYGLTSDLGVRLAL